MTRPLTAADRPVQAGDKLLRPYSGQDKPVTIIGTFGAGIDAGMSEYSYPGDGGNSLYGLFGAGDVYVSRRDGGPITTEATDTE